MSVPAFDHSHVDPCWSVVFDDDTHLTQGDGVVFGAIELDKARQLVVTFAGHTHIVILDEAKRPVYFTKVQKRLSPETGEQSGERRVACVGWQTTVKGTNVKALTWLTQDGQVIHCNDDPGEW